MIRLLLTVLFSLFAFLMHAQRSPVYTIQGELKALSVSDRVAVKLDATLDDQKVYAEFREDIERKDLKIVQRGSTLKIRLQEQKEFRKKRKKTESECAVGYALLVAAKYCGLYGGIASQPSA